VDQVVIQYATLTMRESGIPVANAQRLMQIGLDTRRREVMTGRDVITNPRPIARDPMILRVNGPAVRMQRMRRLPRAFPGKRDRRSDQRTRNDTQNTNGSDSTTHQFLAHLRDP
jgi:hypothetical protein